MRDRRPGANQPASQATTWLRMVARVAGLGLLGLVGLILIGLRIFLLLERVDEQRDLAIGDLCTYECLAAEPEVAFRYGDPSACNGEGRRVCLVPLGSVPLDLIEDLMRYYEERYGLAIGVMPPVALDYTAIDPTRKQGNSNILEGNMTVPVAYARVAGDPDVLMIGVTPVDMYPPFRPQWRYAFWVGNSHPPDERFRQAVVSYARMGSGGDRDERLRKTLNQIVGLSHYGLPESDDPQSPLYGNVLGPADLDRMAPHLPIER